MGMSSLTFSEARQFVDVRNDANPTIADDKELFIQNLSGNIIEVREEADTDAPKLVLDRIGTENSTLSVAKNIPVFLRTEADNVVSVTITYL